MFLKGLRLFLFCCLLSPSVFSQEVADWKLSVNSEDLQMRYDAWLALTEQYDSDHKDSALWAALKLKATAVEIGDPDLLGESHRVLGVYYMDAGLHDQAITNYYSSMSFFDQSSSPDKEVQIAHCYHDLAWVHTYQGELDLASDMFYNALKTYESISPIDTNDLISSCHALGSFYYLYEPNIDSSSYYLRKAIQMSEMLGYSYEEQAEARLELANAYLFAELPEEALPIIDYMKSIPSDSLSDYSQAYIRYLDGLNYQLIGDYQKALDIFLPIYELMILANNHQSETGINLLRQIVKAANQGKIYDVAFKYLSILRETEQETIYKDRQRTTKALEFQYETVRKESQIALQKEQLSLQRKITWIISGGLLIVITFLFVLFIANRKIAEKNKKIEMLMRELHHRVKNNLQVISSLLGLQSMKLEDINAKKAVEEGKERIRAMSLIHQKLYQDKDVTTVNIKDYIQDLVSELSQSYGFAESAQVKVDVPDISMDADTTLPLGLIINELVSNAFKYAFQDIEKPVLELTLIQGHHHSNLVIRDNGKGLPKGFDMSNAQSFGLKLVNLLVKQLNGNIEIQQDNGLKYFLSFGSIN